MVYVPPKYPSEIPTIEDLPNRQDDVDWLYAARYNELKKELRAALTELGVLPKGEYADVRARLDAGIGGDVVGPDSAVDEAIARFNGVTGKIIQSHPGAKIDDTGRLTNAAQPAFQAKATTDQLNIPITTWTTIVLGTERFDIGNNFASNVFTAPISGKYLLSAVIELGDLDIDNSYLYLQLATSNYTYVYKFRVSQFTDDVDWWNISWNVIAPMDANDTAFLRIYVYGGAAQTDIRDGTYFSGALIC